MLPDQRGTTAVLFALLLPALLTAVSLATDVSLWFLQSHRLQIAADAAAHAAAYMLTNSTAQTGSPGSFQIIALNEAKAVTGGTLVGTIATPVSVSFGRNWASVTVNLTSTAPTYFARIIGMNNLTMTAAATAGVSPSTACVLALSASASQAINVNNSGNIVASGCGIFSNSTASNAIYLSSGTIRGSSVGAVGDVSTSNSGSNSLSPSGTDGLTAEANPYSSLTMPSYGGCSYNSASFTAYQATPYTFSGGTVFCGNTTVGGNGSNDQFAPGIYYVVGGSITFNNANIISASGVTFILVPGSNGAVGAFNWINNAGATLSAPTSGSTAGILIWQECSTTGSTPLNEFNGGSTLNISGAIYAPCGQLELDNNAQISTVSGSTSAAVANTITVVGSASLSVVGGASSSGSGGQVALLQ